MSFVVSTILPTTEAWKTLQASSPFASPFQSPEYYDFLLSQDGHKALVVWVSGSVGTGTVTRKRSEGSRLPVPTDPLALIVIDLQSNGFKHLTSRAIVHGGPLISPDCPTDALRQLLTEAINLSRHHHAVYFEIRPYFDYSAYANIFTAVGLKTIDYCDCQVDTSSLETIDRNIQPRKMRQIRYVLRQGIRFVDAPTQDQIIEFYNLFKQKHWQRTRRPIPSLQYFLDLSRSTFATFLLAFHGDTLVSGSVVLHIPSSSSSRFGNNQLSYHYYVAGKDDEFSKLYPSTISTYQFFLFSNKIGSHYASLMGAGRLSIPFGVRVFKQRMGGKTIPTGRYLYIIHPFIYRLASFALNLLHRSNT